ncbi:MAG TPA: hypothetical protein VF543_22530 [Pyrinomonadaceae bacterium]
MNANTSALLINESPLQVLPSLAVAIGELKRLASKKESAQGLNEAIALQQLHYRLRGQKKVHSDGRKWIDDTYGEWQAEHFPFWSEHTVQRIFQELERLKLVISATPGGRDRRKWYTIDYDRVNRLVSDLERYAGELLGLTEEPHTANSTLCQTGSLHPSKLARPIMPIWQDAMSQSGSMEGANLAESTSGQVGSMIKDSKTQEQIPKNTHTQSLESSLSSGESKTCVCAKPHESEFCDDLRRQLAPLIPGVNNPGGYAMCSDARAGLYDPLFSEAARKLTWTQQRQVEEQERVKSDGKIDELARGILAYAELHPEEGIRTLIADTRLSGNELARLAARVEALRSENERAMEVSR